MEGPTGREGGWGGQRPPHNQVYWNIVMNECTNTGDIVHKTTAFNLCSSFIKWYPNHASQLFIF